jgi:hypothetical protein
MSDPDGLRQVCENDDGAVTACKNVPKAPPQGGSGGGFASPRDPIKSKERIDPCVFEGEDRCQRPCSGDTFTCPVQMNLEQPGQLEQGNDLFPKTVTVCTFSLFGLCLMTAQATGGQAGNKPSSGKADSISSKGFITGSGNDEPPLDEVEKQIAKHMDDIVDDFKHGRLTPEELADFNKAKTPVNLGNDLDRILKKRIAEDPFFNGKIEVNEGTTAKGPDFKRVDGARFKPQWYDLTTEGSWQSHVNKYTNQKNFGAGRGIIYQANIPSW